MRVESLVKIATLLGVGTLILVGQGLQPQVAYPAWVSASDAARYASGRKSRYWPSQLAAAAAEMANGAAEVAYSAATEAASSVSEAASLALGLQNDGDDPNAMALAGFHASRADSNKQLHERILAAAAAATGQAPAASASTTVSAATASATASAATPTPTPPKPVQGVDGSIAMSTETPTPTSRPPPSSGELQGEPAWLLRASNSSALLLNAPARAALTTVRQPGGTTLHFTFGSAVMMDFVKNWLHFVRKAGIGPYLVGVSDVPLLDFCNGEHVPAAATGRTRGPMEREGEGERERGRERVREGEREREREQVWSWRGAGVEQAWSRRGAGVEQAWSRREAGMVHVRD